MVLASFNRHACTGAVMFVVLLGAVHSAHAQGAWVEDPGSVTTGLNSEFVPSNAVVLDPHKLVEDRPTQNFVYTLYGEYVPFEKLAIEASLPLDMVKYTGTVPHAPPGKWDDGAFHTTLTDFRIGARYQLLDMPYLAITPFAAFSTPVMNYEVIGFATGGRHLTQGHFGVSVGRTFEPYLPNLYFSGTYEFTLSERYDANLPTVSNSLTESYSENRSDVDGQIGYFFLGGDLNINIGGNYRHTDGGISFDDFGKLLPAITNVHDPILKESFVVAGAGVAYAINRRFTIGAIFRFFIQGYNTRDQSLYGLDLTWHVR